MAGTSSELGFIHRFERGSGRLTMLLLHGTGGDEGDLLGVGRTLVPDASLLSPRGKVLENGMPRYFRRFAEGGWDIEDFESRSKELAHFVEAASVRYRFDQNSVVIVGYSNGANIGAGMLLTESLLPAGAVLFRPMLPFEPDKVPHLKGIRVFVLAGRFDQVVPEGQPERLARLLESGGRR
jgi:phospholipase/carboxylesterase/glyoxalase family protein